MATFQRIYMWNDAPLKVGKLYQMRGVLNGYPVLEIVPTPAPTPEAAPMTRAEEAEETDGRH